MASLEKRNRDGKVTWQARWRDPEGRQRKRSFVKRSDAERHLTGVGHSLLVGTYVDPAAERTTAAEWASAWLDGRLNLEPKTLAG